MEVGGGDKEHEMGERCGMGNPRREKNGEARGRKIGERTEEEKEVCGEIYEEDNVRSVPLKLDGTKGVCEDQAGKEGNV